ncbi:MAG TPA: CYTH and CHAD domain-containing protein [Gaiellaceae bacterium]|nr:CYTH and CHAD domain-containing protein [Gaiellaceae bacterium]
MRATSEHERKLDAPTGFRLPPLGGRPLARRIFTSVYYDVPGASLAIAGITLRRRTEQGRGVWQLKLPAEDSRLEIEAEGGPERPPEQLLALLQAHLRHGPLERIAELRTDRRGELVARNGTTAEVTVDEVAVLDASRVSETFVEVEVELRTGNPAQLDAIADEVASAGAEPGSGLPKVFRALGRENGNAPSARTPFAELRSRLRDQLREIERNDPGTRLGRDPESLHDMRVAVRRLRAMLRAGKELVAADTSELDGRLKELGGVLGEVRDLDVLLARLEDEAGELGGDDARHARSLFAALRTERSCARARLLGALRSDEYLALLDDTARMIDDLRPSASGASLDALADKAFAKARKAVHRLPEEPSDEQLHAVRKKGKRARYAAELAGRKKFVRRAKALQDVLGEHQDGAVAAARLRRLAVEASPEQALAVGRLVEREEERRTRARRAWPRAWQKLRKAI